MKKITLALITMSVLIIVPFCLKVKASNEMIQELDDFRDGTNGWVLSGSNEKSKVDRVKDSNTDNYYINLSFQGDTGSDLKIEKYFSNPIILEDKTLEFKLRVDNEQVTYAPILLVGSDGTKVELATIKKSGSNPYIKVGDVNVLNPMKVNEWVTLGIKFLSSDTVDVYINGARVLEEGKVATLIKNITNMSQLRIYSKRTEGKICNLDFDDFKIISYKEDSNNIIDDDFIVSGETVINDLKKANPNNKHPRILINQEKINEIKASRTSNERVNKWAQAVIEQADEILGKPVSKYEIPDGRRLNAAKDIKKYIEITGMAYLLTDKQVYLERAIQEINAAISFQDWNDNREFLNTATIMSAMAIAYDWFYDDLDDELKTNMKKAIIEKGLNKGIEQINNGAWWSVKKELDSNWNAVCNSGIIMSALAIGDEESDVSGKALERAITSFGKGIITEYGPDGAWGEGPTYWQYALEYIALGLGTLNSALGQDYDISKVEGLNETAHYIAHVSGPQGIFNYGDSPSGALKLRVPELFYLGKLLNDDSITKLGLKMLDDSKKNGCVYDLIWYNTSVTSKELDLPLDSKFRDPDLALMRGSWIDPLSTYIGFKAGKAYMSHGHMDIGNFVFHANGEQWAIDIGTDNYVPGYFNYDTDRFHFYRTRPDGHNTFVINPDQQYQQAYKANNEITTFKSNKNGAYAIADLTPAYNRHVNSAKRGVMLTSFRETMIVQDQITMKAPSDYYWFMHTEANINIQKDGKEVILTKNGKQLLVKIIHGEGTFTEMEAIPLEGTPNPQGDTNKLKVNTGVKKIVVKLENVSNVELAIALVPLYSDEDRDRIPEYKALDQWQLTEGDMEKPLLTGIYINGKLLDGFNSQVRSYTYTIPYGTTDVPIITGKASEGFDVEVSQATDDIVTPVEIKVTDKNNSKSRTHYTVLLTTQSLEQLPKGAEEVKIVEATASAYQDTNTPQNTLDEDFSTRWSAQGEQWIQFDLGLVTKINMVGISFSKGNVRSSIFDIEVSKDGTNWKKILNGKSRGTSLDFEYFTFLAEEARYVRVNGKGNTSNDWNSYTGVKIYKYKK
ncbi:discoidin domain-containing protein [Vallitalea guaymasensis]|uniref:discoidin domain-containing protein n=1 Tax=Vallitalea guaymasensis TaxID=1185412 RepID=UPI000DE20B85|nr:discoidin domain-containing protein [Vallitalea guaymasensis]